MYGCGYNYGYCKIMGRNREGRDIGESEVTRFTFFNNVIVNGYWIVWINTELELVNYTLG